MWRVTCVAALSNHNGISLLENAAFESKHPYWGTVLIITSEFHPRNEVLDWAKKLADSEKYKNSTVIFMTHAYLQEGESAELIKKRQLYYIIMEMQAFKFGKNFFSLPKILIC